MSFTPFSLTAGISQDRGSVSPAYQSSVKIVTPPPLQAGNDFSFVMWARRDRTILNDGRCLAGNWDTADHAWLFQTAVGDDTALRFFIAASAGDAGSNYIQGPAGSMVQGRWQRVGVRYQRAVGPRAASADIFVNGVRVTTTTVGTLPSAMRATSGAMYLGSSANAGDPEGNWLGDYAHAMMYFRALSDEEFAADYAGRSVDQGRVAWWPCDDGSGSTARNVDGSCVGTVRDRAVWITAKQALCTNRVLVVGNRQAIGYSAYGYPDGCIRRYIARGIGAREASGLVQMVGDYSDGPFGENRHSGVDNDTIALCAARLPAVLAAFAPTIVVIACGSDDIAGYVPTTTIGAYNTGLVAPVLAAGARAICCTIPPYSGSANIPLFNAELYETLLQGRIQANSPAVGADVAVADCYNNFVAAWGVYETGQWFQGQRIAQVIAQGLGIGQAVLT